ncbi:MAG: DUF1289 domain-containing protein [Halioglobus sp.]
MSTADPQSPCISICVLDEKDICQGCFRSAAEITDWFMATTEEKQDILNLAKERLSASRTIFLK